jgi:hypothetical protein
MPYIYQPFALPCLKEAVKKLCKYLFSLMKKKQSITNKVLSYSERVLNNHTSKFNEAQTALFKDSVRTAQ